MTTPAAGRRPHEVETHTRDATRTAARPRRGLVPADEEIGWTPYVWLVYLPIFLASPVLRWREGTLTVAHAAATVLGLALFLAVYFRSYWVSGRALLPIILVQALLGVGFAFVNPGAFVFFVYAGSVAGRLTPTAHAVKGIVVVASVGVLTAWLVHMPPYGLPLLALLTLLVGGLNVHETQVRRANARLRLAQEQIAHLATVSERERIARDLHDLLGHTLSLVVLKSELAVKLVSRDAARAAQEMRDVERVSRNALQEVREAIRGYRPSLAEEVERSRTLLAAASIHTELHVDAAPSARAAEEALALALREAVTNVVRHSGAETCRIRVRADADACVLEVEDDGRGSSAPAGSGLRGMHERIEALGGTLASGRAPGRRGWRLEARVPSAPAMLLEDARRPPAAGDVEAALTAGDA